MTLLAQALKNLRVVVGNLPDQIAGRAPP